MEKLTPDNSTPIPHDLTDKYSFLYLDNGKFIEEKFSAILEIIKMVYNKGVEDGRN